MHCSFKAYACAIFCMLFFNPGYTQENIIAQSSFIWDESTLVLEYRRFNSLLGSDQATVLQVYGDGTIVVIFPPSHSKAGKYSLSLLSSELDALVADVVHSNQQVGTGDQMPKDHSKYFAVSDSTFTEIDLNIESYSLTSGELITLDSMVTIREKDLLLSSRHLASPNRLANLAELENSILNLTRDSRLVKQ